jgi:hypothetical protein
LEQGTSRLLSRIESAAHQELLASQAEMDAEKIAKED